MPRAHRYFLPHHVWHLTHRGQLLGFTASTVCIAMLAVGCGAGRSTRGQDHRPPASSEGKPRESVGHVTRQHYTYAHKVLPRLFFDTPERFHDLVQKDGERFLLWTWNRVGDDVADPMSIDSSQLNVQKREAEGREIFIVTFPPPQAMPEAYFAAMVYAEGTPSRYLTLERSFDLLTNQVITMLGEWHKDGDHGNLGFGPNPTVDGFLEAVVALITNGTRVPDRPQNTDVEAGGAIYHGKGVCFVCHGPNGKGDGEAGARLKPPPTDFTDPRFQESRTDSDLFRAIRDGIPRTGMISMNPAMINDTETWDVIAYIRSLKGM